MFETSFRENPNDALSPTITIEVVRWQAASAAGEAYLAPYHFGGGNWTGGQIYEDGRPVARVSYHGRVGDLDKQCVYDPARS